MKPAPDASSMPACKKNEDVVADFINIDQRRSGHMVIRLVSLASAVDGGQQPV